MQLIDLMGVKVEHKAYGIGSISGLTPNGIQCAFETSSGVFAYKAFGKAIKAIDLNYEKFIELLSSKKDKDEKAFIGMINDFNKYLAAEEKPKMKTIKINVSEFPSFDKTFEIINYLTGRELKGWMQGTYNFNKVYFAWFPHLTTKGKSKKAGWINELSEDGKVITERNDDLEMNIDWSEWEQHRRRLVFADFDGKKPYRFLGIFEHDNNESTKHMNVYKKVSDEIDLSELM